MQTRVCVIAISNFANIHSNNFYSDICIWVDMRVLFRRWSWNDHSSVALGKKLCTSIIQIYWGIELFEVINSFTQKVVLKRPFVVDTGEETIHIHCSGLLGNKALWVNMIFLLRRLSWKGQLSWHWIGKFVHSSCLLVEIRLSQYDSFLRRQSWKDHASVMLGKNLLCLFIVEIFWETDLFGSLW